MTRLMITLVVLLLSGFDTAHATQVGDKTLLKRIILAQTAAFRAGDMAKAFAFASPALHRHFRTPSSFMRMVRRNYSAVIDPRLIAFGRVVNTPIDRPIQTATIIDHSGRRWQAVYQFQRHAGGGWSISAVSLKSRR